MAFLNAGDLDRRIIIQTGVDTGQSASGEQIIDWTQNQKPAWVQWLPSGTREAWQAQQRLGSYIDGVFVMYDRSPRPTPDRTRIVFDGRTYDVKPYVEIGRGEGLEVPVVARGEL